MGSTSSSPTCRPVWVRSWVQGVGGALSPVLAGAIDQAAGYTVVMLSLTAIAAVALVLLIVSVPETRAPDVEPASTRAG